MNIIEKRITESQEADTALSTPGELLRQILRNQIVLLQHTNGSLRWDKVA